MFPKPEESAKVAYNISSLADPPFGDWLRRERLSRSWNQRGMAERSGISQTTISKIESGRAPEAACDRENIRRIAAAFEIPVAEAMIEARLLPDEIDDETAGKGLGIVDLFDADGRFISRLASFGELNAPWGVALAPRSFGTFGGALLIGNFGDGTINAYDMRTGSFLGKLRRANGNAVKIEGLWGISFGNGLLNQPTNTLYFAAGVHDEAGGAYGSITVHSGN